MLTTPPGTSLVPIASLSVIALSGYFSLAITIAVFPPASTGASECTSPSSEGFAGAKTATTPSESGIVKL